MVLICVAHLWICFRVSQNYFSLLIRDAGELDSCNKMPKNLVKRPLCIWIQIKKSSSILVQIQSTIWIRIRSQPFSVFTQLHDQFWKKFDQVPYKKNNYNLWKTCIQITPHGESSEQGIKAVLRSRHFLGSSGSGSRRSRSRLRLRPNWVGSGSRQKKAGGSSSGSIH